MDKLMFVITRKNYVSFLILFLTMQISPDTYMQVKANLSDS